MWVLFLFSIRSGYSCAPYVFAQCSSHPRPHQCRRRLDSGQNPMKLHSPMPRSRHWRAQSHRNPVRIRSRLNDANAPRFHGLTIVSIAINVKKIGHRSPANHCGASKIVAQNNKIIYIQKGLLATIRFLIYSKYYFYII